MIVKKENSSNNSNKSAMYSGNAEELIQKRNSTNIVNIIYYMTIRSTCINELMQ